MNLKNYTKPKKSLWRGRVDQNTTHKMHNSLRWHQVMQTLNLLDLSASQNKNKKIALLGFCSDEGVRRNHGRIGAAKGPAAIRKALMNLPAHFNDAVLFDAGDVMCVKKDLESAQKSLALAIENLHAANISPIVLGGGHEMAFGHGLGVYKAFPKERVGIINFDAHFDLRPVIDGQSSSGTPFLQLSGDCARRGAAFNYLCIGIQKSANTASLFQTANQLGVEFIEREELFLTPLKEIQNKISQFLSRVDVVYLTICLDAFAQSFAPGVSAPSAAGLEPRDFFPLFDFILKSQKVVSFDIAEMAPNLDRDQQTARLAAKIIFEFVSK